MSGKITSRANVSRFSSSLFLFFFFFFFFRFSERVLVEYCLQALLSHSTIKSHALAMSRGLCLPVLDRVAREYRDNPRILSLVGKIVANLSLHPEVHDVLFATGWVGVLAAWKQDPNLLVTLPATKALCNMDQAYGKDVYEPGIYLLLPQERTVKWVHLQG